MWKNEADPFTCFMKAAADMCKDGFVRDVLSNLVQVKEDALKLQEIFRSSKANSTIPGPVLHKTFRSV